MAWDSNPISRMHAYVSLMISRDHPVTARHSEGLATALEASKVAATEELSRVRAAADEETAAGTADVSAAEGSDGRKVVSVSSAVALTKFIRIAGGGASEWRSADADGSPWRTGGGGGAGNRSLISRFRRLLLPPLRVSCSA